MNIEYTDTIEMKEWKERETTSTATIKQNGQVIHMILTVLYQIKYTSMT